MLPLASRNAALAPRAGAKEGEDCTASARAANGPPAAAAEEEKEEEEEEEEEESAVGNKEATAALIFAALASTECAAPRRRWAWARARSSAQ